MAEVRSLTLSTINDDDAHHVAWHRAPVLRVSGDRDHATEVAPARYRGVPYLRASVQPALPLWWGTMLEEMRQQTRVMLRTAIPSHVFK